MLTQGDRAQALALTRRALAIRETDEGRAFFVQCVKGLHAGHVDDELRSLIARALSEGWSRPSELAPLAAELCNAKARNGLAAVAGDALLLSLRAAGPVQNIELERFLTASRKELLRLACDPLAPNGLDQTSLFFFCALARQCFINEYVFAATENETRQADELRQLITEGIACGRGVSALRLIAVAAYNRLHKLPRARSLLDLSWPSAVQVLIEEQVRQPLDEEGIGRAIGALTPIEDEVSIKVRRQYEEMPYPRWIRSARAVQPVTLE
jgi:hypothetical protein